MNPCLNLAIARLAATGKENFAIWVLKAPYPGGYVLHDCVWSSSLSSVWQEWQQMFAIHCPLDFSSQSNSQPSNPLPLELVSTSGQPTAYTSRLMQYLGISLWQWLFSGTIKSSLERSQGIAMGLDKPLRIRLEIRDPDLIALPWEIMQPQAGKPAISLSQQLLFSRTTSDVDPLPVLQTDQALNILLVLGENKDLQLEKEAAILEKTLLSGGNTGSNSMGYAPCMVDTLVQPTPEQLISQLENQAYNVFFYAGHGLPAPDGGLLFLRPDMSLNGTELAQVLTRTGVTLAVFNACWGAQPAAINHQAIPRSSLAEVLIHHGVPAVLGMRDSIADHESHTFIQTFAQALRERKPIDQAVAIARQQLLTLYKFNQPAWTLPVLYLHPEFDGELLRPFDEGITELPDTSISNAGKGLETALLRSLSPQGQTWSLRGVGVSRIGRTGDNDIVIPEAWVSRRHAEIFCRNSFGDYTPVTTYFLRDFSAYGTLILGASGWQKIHHQEVPLEPGMQLKFGSSRGQTLEFIIKNSLV